MTGIGFEESLNKDFISEKLQLNNIKEQLEKTSRCESVTSIIAEDLYNAEELCKKDTTTKDDLASLAKIFSRIHINISNFVVRHQKKLSEESRQQLKLTAHSFKVSGRLFELRSRSVPPLKTNDSLTNLKRWVEVLEIYTELVDGVTWKVIPPGVRIFMEHLSNSVIDVTSTIYIDNPKKEKCRRAIRNSAGFISQWLESQNLEETEDFAIGITPRNKLLKETKNRLHLLDVLSPSNNEEAKEQHETREFLIKVLGE